MKKILFGALLLTGCASVPQMQTPQQIAAQVCPSVRAVLTMLSVPGTVPNVSQQDLANVAPTVDKVCLDLQNVDALSLRALHNNAVPILMQIINASNLPEQDKQAAIATIMVAHAAVDPFINRLPASSAK